MSKRSYEKEIMDLGPGYYSESEYNDCLVKLYHIGALIGINRDAMLQVQRWQPKTLLDVGCGSGLLLHQIAKRFSNIACKGIEISDTAYHYAIQHTQPNLHFALSHEIAPADLIMAILVCHHTTDEECVSFLETAYAKANKAVLIYDLQRSKISKFLYRLISPWLFRNRLITHDGALSIDRAFTRNDLKQLLKKANIPEEAVTIRWRFPFRWEVILCKR